MASCLAPTLGRMAGSGLSARRPCALGWAFASLAALYNLAGCSSAAKRSTSSGRGGANSADASVDGGAAFVHARFDLSAGSMSFGAIPWPDDLYRDAKGRVTLADVPGAVASDYAAGLLRALPDLDGFGVLSPVYFYFNGEIDIASLPSDAAASTSPMASVFLMDADTGSPEAFRRIPASMQWRPAERRLAIRPAIGHPLTPGRRYAAVVTRGLRSAEGAPVQAASRFAAVRDPLSVLNDALLMQARAEYTPVIETLVNGGMSRDDISAIAVFTVQSVASDLKDARAIVRGDPLRDPTINVDPLRDPTINDVVSGAQLDVAFGKPPAETVGLDQVDGASHGNLAAMVQGTLPSPNFLSATAKTHGAFERDEAAQLRVKRTEDVPFTLFVPKINGTPAPSAGWPVVIVQHALGRERSDAVLFANKLAQVGFAVIAIDAPFHGLRAKGADERNRFTGTSVPDGFGDASGDFFGMIENEGGLLPMHPFYARDALRQGTVDLMTVVRHLEEGSWRAVGAFDATLKGLSFDRKHIGFIGIDIGAQMGVPLAALEPTIGAVVLGQAGAGLSESWSLSPSNQALFATLAHALGRDPGAIDYAADPPVFWPELALVQTLLDRAEPLAHAATLARTPTNVLLQMAQDDEVVPNLATEALGFSLGATLVSTKPRYVVELGTRSLAAGEGLSGNFTIDNGAVTRVLYPFDPATHDVLIHVLGTEHYAHPPLPPFQVLAQDNTVGNPLAAALVQVASYLGTWYSCVSGVQSPMPTSTCAGVVRAP